MLTAEQKNFITNVYESGEFEGCQYMYIDDTDYAIVFAWCPNEFDDETDRLVLNCKIAYNCDALQCDYDFDWYLGADDDGELIDTEITDCQELTLTGLLLSIEDCLEVLKDCKKISI